METILSSFVDAYKECNHIAKLLKDQVINILIEVEDSFYFLTLTQEQAIASLALVQESTSAPEEVTITGDYDNIAKLLSGEFRLRDAASRDKIKLNATFKDSLLLETVFFLTEKGNLSKLLGKGEKI